MKYTLTKTSSTFLLTAILGFLSSLAGCSSDDAAAIIADEFITVSGQTTNGASPEAGVTLKGIYSDGNVLNASTSSAADGSFSLKILKNTPVSLQISKSSFATLNSAKEALSVDESGYDVELVPATDAQTVIDNVFSGPTLTDYAWLVVNVVDSTDAQLGGVTINTTGSPVAAAATDCIGMDSGDIVTIAPCIPSRDGPMYFAYFDTESTEVTVTAGSSSQLAPVRRGEVTVLDFTQ